MSMNKLLADTEEIYAKFSEKCKLCGDPAHFSTSSDNYYCYDCAVKEGIHSITDDIVTTVVDTMTEQMDNYLENKENDNRIKCNHCGKKITKDCHIHIELDEDLKNKIYFSDELGRKTIDFDNDVTSYILCEECEKKYKKDKI